MVRISLNAKEQYLTENLVIFIKKISSFSPSLRETIYRHCPYGSHFSSLNRIPQKSVNYYPLLLLTIV